MSHEVLFTLTFDWVFMPLCKRKNQNTQLLAIRNALFCHFLSSDNPESQNLKTLPQIALK